MSFKREIFARYNKNFREEEEKIRKEELRDEEKRSRRPEVYRQANRPPASRTEVYRQANRPPAGRLRQAEIRTKFSDLVL